MLYFVFMQRVLVFWSYFVYICSTSWQIDEAVFFPISLRLVSLHVLLAKVYRVPILCWFWNVCVWLQVKTKIHTLNPLVLRTSAVMRQQATTATAVKALRTNIGNQQWQLIMTCSQHVLWDGWQRSHCIKSSKVSVVKGVEWLGCRTQHGTEGFTPNLNIT